MKFFKIVPLILASLIAFSGCTPKSTAETASSTAQKNNESSKTEDEDFTGKTLTIGLWGGNDVEQGAVNKIKANFESTTGAKVDIKIYTDYDTQIQADFVAKTAPDVFYVDASNFPFFESLGVMEPLDATEMNTSAFYPNLIDAFTSEDGTLYSVPKDTATLAIYYNNKLLNSVGMTEDDVPQNWEEYKTFLPELQAKLDEVHGKGNVTAMTVNLELARNIHLLERDGASVSDAEGRSTFDTDGVKKNLGFIVDLTNTGAYKTPVSLGFGWNGEVFGAEKTVLMDEGNWVYGFLKQNYTDLDFGVTDMPAYEGTKSSMAFTVGYSIYSNSKEKELAKEWIKYATGMEGMSIWAGEAQTLPARPDVTEALKISNDPILSKHTAQIEYAMPWQKGTTIKVIDNAYKNFIINLVDGKATIDETTKEIDEQANSDIGA